MLEFQHIFLASLGSPTLLLLLPFQAGRPPDAWFRAIRLLSKISKDNSHQFAHTSLWKDIGIKKLHLSVYCYYLLKPPCIGVSILCVLLNISNAHTNSDACRTNFPTYSMYIVTPVFDGFTQIKQLYIYSIYIVRVVWLHW